MRGSPGGMSEAIDFKSCANIDSEHDDEARVQSAQEGLRVSGAPADDARGARGARGGGNAEAGAASHASRSDFLEKATDDDDDERNRELLRRHVQGSSALSVCLEFRRALLECLLQGNGSAGTTEFRFLLLTVLSPLVLALLVCAGEEWCGRELLSSEASETSEISQAAFENSEISRSSTSMCSASGRASFASLAAVLHSKVSEKSKREWLGRRLPAASVVGFFAAAAQVASAFSSTDSKVTWMLIISMYFWYGSCTGELSISGTDFALALASLAAGCWLSGSGTDFALAFQRLPKMLHACAESRS